MKLERLQEYVLPVVATLAGMAFAGYLGYLMGQGLVSRVALMLGLLFFGFLTMVMRQYIWLLIVVTWPWPGSIPVLPVPLSVRDLGVLAVFVAYLGLKALKVARRKPQWGPADLAMVVLLVYIATVFVRNPVGFLATNSMRVGCRPYLNIVLACVGYFVLARASIPVRSASRIIILTVLASSWALTILNAIADFSPRIGRALLNYYTGLSVAQEVDVTKPALAPGEVVERYDYLGYLGSSTNLALVSFYRAFEVVNPIYIARFLLLLFSTACILLSGFRSAFIGTIAYFAISSYLRSGWDEIVRLGIIALLGLGIVVAGQGRLYDLPLAAQRALSFLPGAWSYTARESASASSEWRFEMWRIMLQGNKYVQSKWFGDGFGISKRDMAAMAYANQMGTGGQETMLILGAVHNGPLSTVRFVGYVGLVLYLVVLVLIARFAWQLARRSQGTPYLPLAFFVAIPLVYEPFNFVFIFGGFDSAVPQMIYSLGMLKLVQNTLDDHFEVKTEAAPASRRRAADPQFALAGGGR